MNKNIIIKNIFTEEERQTLRSIIKDILSKDLNWLSEHPKDEQGNLINTADLITMMKHDLGRIIIHNITIPENIVNKLNQIIKNQGFDGYFYQDATTYWEYNYKYGNPKLRDHKDTTEADETLHFDYQLDSTLDWAVTVEDTPYILKDNDALTFMGKVQEHGRPVIKFKEGDYLSNFLFRFNTKDTKELAKNTIKY